VNLREALINQHPSLVLQRAAADEIARLDAKIARLENCLFEMQNAAIDLAHQLDSTTPLEETP
jgi:hypothetical protein